MKAAALWVVVAGCASAPAGPASAPGASSESASAPSSESAPGSASAIGSAPAPGSASGPVGPPPVGGSVLIGEINAPKSFEPRPTLLTLQPKLLDCYNQTRASRPTLHGKLTLHIVINEGGQALSAEADPGGNAYDPGLVQCIEGVLKAGPKFPKPGGTATVAAPLVFRP